MRTAVFKIPCLLIFLTWILSACNLPAGTPLVEASPPTEPPAVDITATRAETATPTAQAELIPTETLTLTATGTPSPGPGTAALVEAPKAKVNRETNCRTGPGSLYDLVVKYQAGQVLDVVGTGLAQGYWFVRNPEKAEEQCYLLAQNVTLSGDTSALPKFTPPPSPTSAPFFEAKFKKLDNCKGVFANFSVENTGSASFRSAYIKVTDTKVNKSVEQALDAFDLFVGCTLAKNIAPLDPGGTGYVHSPAFNWAVHEDKLRAVIMLCTEKDLKGSCVSRTVEVKK
jgi:hypothetical protein